MRITQGMTECIPDICWKILRGGGGVNQYLSYQSIFNFSFTEKS
jgi:hypothetical protein